MPEIIQPESHIFAPSSDAPNNQRLPVLIYKQVVEEKTSDKAQMFEKIFAKNDWSGTWQDTIYDYRHFHSNAHEALGITDGHVSLEVGGDNGRIFQLNPGDLIVLPAGTAHKRVSTQKSLVVGAYPRGQEQYNICRNFAECVHVYETIPHVALPTHDPFYGSAGPLMQLWKT